MFLLFTPPPIFNSHRLMEAVFNQIMPLICVRCAQAQNSCFSVQDGDAALQFESVQE